MSNKVFKSLFRTPCGTNLISQTEHLLSLSLFISRDLIITYGAESMRTYAHNTQHTYIMKTNISEAFSIQTDAPTETDIQGSIRQSFCWKQPAVTQMMLYIIHPFCFNIKKNATNNNKKTLKDTFISCTVVAFLASSGSSPGANSGRLF